MGAEESKAHQAANGGVTSYMLDAILEHGGPINCMALSEDESILATGSDDRSVRLWTTRTPRCHCIGILTGHAGFITCVLVDEVYCLSGSVDATVRKWDMATCECMGVYEAHTDRINRLICTGDFVFSSSSDSTVRCWDLEDGKCIRTFNGHGAGVFPLQYVIPSDDDVIRTAEDEDDDDTRMLAPTPIIRDLLLTGSKDCTARAWSFETGRTITTFVGHTGPVTCLGTDIPQSILVTASTDGSVRSWSLKTGEPWRILEGHRMAVTCMSIGDGAVYTGSSDCTARSFSLEGKSSKLVFLCHEKPITCIKYSKGQVFTGGGDNMVTCFDGSTGAIKRIFRCPPDTQINAFQIVEGRIYVGSSDRRLRIYTLRGLRPFQPVLKPLSGLTDPSALHHDSSGESLSSGPPSRNSGCGSATDSPLTSRSSVNGLH